MNNPIPPVQAAPAATDIDARIAHLQVALIKTQEQVTALATLLEQAFHQIKTLAGGR